MFSSILIAYIITGIYKTAHTISKYPVAFKLFNRMSLPKFLFLFTLEVLCWVPSAIYAIHVSNQLSKKGK